MSCCDHDDNTYFTLAAVLVVVMTDHHSTGTAVVMTDQLELCTCHNASSTMHFDRFIAVQIWPRILQCELSDLTNSPTYITRTDQLLYVQSLACSCG